MERRLFALVGAARAMLAVTVALALLGAAVTVGQMALVSHVIDRAFLMRQGLTGLRLPLLLLLVAIVLRAVLRWARELTAQRGAILVKTAVRDRLFAHLLRLGPAYTRGERTGELVTVATNGVERLDPYIARYLPQVPLSALVPLGIAACVIPLDPFSGILLLLTAPVIPVMMILVGSYAEAPITRQWTALARMSAYFLDTIQGLPTLKLFGRSKAEAERVGRVSEEFRVRTMKALRYAFLSGLVLEFMTSMAIALIAVELGVRLLNAQIGFAQSFFILLVAPEFYRPLRELGVHRHASIEGKAAMERVFAILDTPAPTSGAQCEVISPAAPLTIAITGLQYTYPGATRPALRDMTLMLPAGSRTALVGPSGGGKSTLVNLVLRFMEPDAGAITANGIAIRDLPPERWRQYIALVPQRPYLFTGSVIENIRLARPDASRAAVEDAARRAHAHAFIAALPDGYDTLLGERGAGLSAGQAQRIAIARAFLKDAPFLILDEPTSALDPESEEHVSDALAHLMTGRTVLVIAHRRRTVAAADRIAVLDGGHIVESGTRTELLARGAHYAALVGEPLAEVAR